jgi:hypothetical protein
MRWLLSAIFLACSAVAVNAGVLIEGNLQGGEVAKGRWKPDLSAFHPFAKKAEEALPPTSKDEVNKLKHFLEHIHTPGCSWDLVVRLLRFGALITRIADIFLSYQPQRSKLKLRKIFNPLGITDLVLGLDFDPRQGEWRYTAVLRHQHALLQ